MLARSRTLQADRPHPLVTRTSAALGLRFTVLSRLEPADQDSRVDLVVETEWPWGLDLLGHAVELALLSRREATKSSPS